jgi:hypothetical protein
MKFRIDLGKKNDVSLYMQIERNIMNIYFAPRPPAEPHDALQVKEDFSYLMSNISRDGITSIETDSPDDICDDEDLDPHVQITFSQEVTPDRLRDFLNALLGAQRNHSTQRQYQFLDMQTAHLTHQSYGDFYHQYKRELQKFSLFALSQTRPAQPLLDVNTSTSALIMANDALWGVYALLKILLTCQHLMDQGNTKDEPNQRVAPN